ncbi:MAG: hypothetical protein IJ752_09135 [Alphaproteobacteria bacterium]|nr:hypothetical protein [Alphaproteobacteria bacterium]
MSEEKNCKATLYLCTPLPMLKPSYNPFKRGGITGFTGHAFVGLTDENGKETLWSYSYKEAKNDLQKITGCPGSFTRAVAKFEEYNEAIVYPITREQFDAANKKVEELKAKEDMKYRLFSTNCSTVAASILRAAGVGKCPVTAMSPHGLVLKKRALLIARRIEVGLFKAANKIRETFGKEKAPDSKLLDSLRSKPMPVMIREGTRTFNYETTLDTNRIVDMMVDRNAHKEKVWGQKSLLDKIKDKFHKGR